MSLQKAFTFPTPVHYAPDSGRSASFVTATSPQDPSQFYPAQLAEQLGMMPLTGFGKDITEAGMQGTVEGAFTQEMV